MCVWFGAAFGSPFLFRLIINFIDLSGLLFFVVSLQKRFTMKIKDLPETTLLNTVKVILPEDVYLASSLPFYRIKNVPVYLQGWFMGDFFVKIDPKSSKIYPMFWGVVPDDILEWEVSP